jgi:ketosteroid isomerase-like protein
MIKISFYSIILLSILSCNAKSETDTETEERINKESVAAKEIISKYNSQIEKLYKAKQIDSIVNYMAENVIQFPPNSKPLIGKDSIRNYWKQLFQFGDIDFSIQTQDVKANGPLAIELGEYNLKFTPVANSPIPAFVDSGHYLVYWHKTNDGWKAVWDAPVSTMPPPSVNK